MDRRIWELATLAVLTLSAATLRANVQTQVAREILETAGVKGGLTIHLGCGDGKLTAALRAGDGFLVQGLDTDSNAVGEARKYIMSQGLYGPVSVDRLTGACLPYVDNFVNLLVAERLGEIPMSEVTRVLAPNGVACLKEGQGWKRITKPWPKEIDEWTHYFHDATANPVAHDTTVGPPRRYQWLGSPRWSRHHDHMSSISALVSAHGRLFYIMDEGSRASIQLPAHWSLIARDAFNGTILWKRSIPAWNTHKWPLKSGPAQVTRRLVAVGETVYVTLGLDAPLTALDAATGRTIRTYEGTANTEEIIVSNGVAFLLVNDEPSKWPQYRQEFSYVWSNSQHANTDWPWDEQPRNVVAVETGTGKVLWKKQSPVAPLTLAADSRRVCFHDGQKIVCLDRTDAHLLWESEAIPRRPSIASSFGPRLLVWQDVVLFAGGTRSMTAVAAQTGKTLWTGQHFRSGHQSPEDLFIVQDLVWSAPIANTTDTGIYRGLDPRTGELKKQFSPDVDIYWFHHRCYPSKATDRYLLTSRNGTEFIDPEKETWLTNHWVRGACLYGVLPCNGLLYAPPHPCGCYLEAKLCGFNALAPESAAIKQIIQAGRENRLEKGPAYAAGLRSEESSGDWPTYRHDSARSGSVGTSVGEGVTRLWQTEVPGRLSATVVAEGRLFVASIDAHSVYALSTSSGERLWSYTAGGRVDSPPTIWKGRVLFGSADGWVYCLRASDGALIWRFRAAPADLRMTAYEQVESLWPVHGSVLVQDGVLYCTAGRSMFLDGGLRLLRLDPATGRMLSETVLDDRDPDTGKNLQSYVKGLTMPVALPDILSSDGRSVYMRSQEFDLNGVRRRIAPLPVDEQTGEGSHLFCQIGFLDDSWFFRSYWMYGRAMGGGYGGWFRAGRLTPSGRIMVFNDQTIYGYARNPEFLTNASVLEYELYAADKQVKPEAIQRVSRSDRVIDANSPKKNANTSDWELRHGFPADLLWAVDARWSRDRPPVLARAMVLADRTLFVAGPPDVSDEVRAFYKPDDPEVHDALLRQEAAFENRSGGLLLAVSATDGKELARYPLDSVPVWDGMAAARGQLFLATMDGKVVCLGPRR